MEEQFNQNSEIDIQSDPIAPQEAIKSEEDASAGAAVSLLKEPQPVSQPMQAQTAQPTPIPQEVTIPQPDPTPQAVQTPQANPIPQAAQTSQPITQSAQTPQANPTPQSIPTPQPAPIPQPTPTPQANPIPQPTPTPQVNPIPQPTPQQAPPPQNSYYYETGQGSQYTADGNYMYNANYNNPPVQEPDTNPLSLGEWLLTILAYMIPCFIGVGIYFYWAFSKTGNINRRNYCRAALIISGVLFVLYLIFMMFFGVAFINAMNSW